MEIIKVKLNEIKPYEHNAKRHPQEQIEQIKKSIEEFGNNDPIAIDENNTIIEGHGRYYALKELGYNEVECIRLDHLSEEQKKAYILVHNKLTMNSDFDFEILDSELNNIININMEDYGFEFDIDLGIEEDLEEKENPYTAKINIPQYEIKGEEPEINELFDYNKTQELIDEIEASNITQEQKDFLIKGAMRHIAFNYSNIAEYYAHQDKEMQELMEKSALVIIDYEDAIRYGYAELIKGIEEVAEDEDE